MSGEQRAYTRFSVAQRIEHATMFTSFIILAVTGLPQKFATAGWAQGLINLLGGIDTTRQIHHAAAIVLLVVSAWHILAVGYRLYVQRVRPAMLPGLNDVRDGVGAVLYNLGRRRERPQGDRFTWEEKVEYWSLVWGVLIMAITGFMMWNPIATTNLLPGEFIPAAKVAHGSEAILAVLAVIIWHFYSVHLRKFNKSMFTGKITEHEMLEEHPLELAQIKAGATTPAKQIDPVAYRKRQLRYGPIAGVLGAVMLFGIYRFMTFEKTAIETVPPPIPTNVVVYSPLTPTPLPTPRPTATPEPTKAVVMSDWDSIASIFERHCVTCHNGSVAGLDLSTYAGVMKGGNDGAVVKPGDPANSLIITKIQGGTHPGKVSPAELQAMQAWIANGASETGGGAPVTGAAADTWDNGIQQLIAAKCAACHVNNNLGGLSLKTYQDALKGGNDGPAVVPDDPAKSLLVEIQQKGGHPGQFSPDEIDRIIAWIKAGAPETAGAAAPTPQTATTPSAAPAATPTE